MSVKTVTVSARCLRCGGGFLNPRIIEINGEKVNWTALWCPECCANAERNHRKKSKNDINTKGEKEWQAK